MLGPGQVEQASRVHSTTCMIRYVRVIRVSHWHLSRLLCCRACASFTWRSRCTTDRDASAAVRLGGGGGRGFGLRV